MRNIGEKKVMIDCIDVGASMFYFQFRKPAVLLLLRYLFEVVCCAVYAISRDQYVF